MLLLARCTAHQSMPIVMTLSPELRVQEPTVGGIQYMMAFQQVFIQRTTSTVMAYNLNWLIITLEKSNAEMVTVICGVLGIM